MRRYLGLVVLVVACAADADLWAQAVTLAQISGTVRDESGALVPGAEVKVTQTDTGYSRTVVTDDTGAYAIPNLPVGPYRLEVSMPGFSTYVQTGIVLQVRSNPSIHVTLKVGGISERIEVNAGAAMVETRDNSVGQLIDQERIVELPLNGRQISQLVTLSGGATEFVPVSAGQSLTSNKNYPTVSAFSVAGGQGGQTLFLLDGNVNMDPMSNVGLPMPFPDALQEFKVETSSLPANYGMAPAGVVNVITKSGGNTVHGSAFAFMRNYKFNATNTFAAKDEFGKRLKDGLKRNQLGGVIGGPILKNRIFYFAGYQGTWESVEPAANVSYVATQAVLQGDWTAMASPACRGGSGITLRAPFVNNRIDPALYSPVALNLLKYIPISNDPCGKLTYKIPTSSQEDQLVAKVDWQLKTNQAFFVRYFFADYSHPPKFTDNLLTLSTDASAGLKGRVQSFVIGHTLTLSSSTMNVFRAGYSRSAMLRYMPDNTPTPTSLGANVVQQYKPYLNINVSTYFTVACTNCNPGPWVSNSVQLSNELNMLRGPHQISVGANMVYNQLNSVGSFQMNGIFAFNGQATGNALADLLVGKPSSFGQDNGQVGHDRIRIPSLFVQDNIRLNPRLSINIGLRWDPYLLPYHAQKQASIFDRAWFDAGRKSKVFPNAPAGTLFYGDEGMPGASYARRRLAEFAPRFGIVFDPRAKGLETIRAGYGIFYATTPLFLQLGLHSPYTLRISIPSPAGGFDPYKGSVYGTSPFPWPANPPSTTKFPDFLGLGLGSFKLDIKPTYMQQWNLAIQKQLPGDWMLSATYIGNRTVHLTFNEPQNYAVYIPGQCAAGQYGLTAPGPCSTTGNINYRRILYLANPAEGKGYGALSNFGDGANANYHGMILSAQNRFASNYSVMANYTLSHCLTESEVGLNGSGASQDPRNRHAEYGNCLSSRRHVFNLSMVLRSPRFDSRWMRTLLSHWQASPIFTAMSGTYSTVTLGIDNSLTGGADRPNVTGDPKLDKPAVSKWFNTAAFSRPSTGSFGNSGRGTILGPGAWNMDLALSRSFPIGDRQKVDFRWETFNVMNHVRYNNPVTNFSSGAFGQILSARDPRIMQFAVKYAF